MDLTILNRLGVLLRWFLAGSMGVIFTYLILNFVSLPRAVNLFFILGLVQVFSGTLSLLVDSRHSLAITMLSYASYLLADIFEFNFQYPNPKPTLVDLSSRALFASLLFGCGRVLPRLLSSLIPTRWRLS